MGFRFRRRICILPGVEVNLPKSGVSTSIGTRGAHVTVGYGETKTTAGVLGTGVSYTTARRGTQVPGWVVWVAIIGTIALAIALFGR